MRLDATDLRYITPDEFRVLTATEIGSKNHEVVPSALIAEISGIRGGQVNKLMGQLAKRNLIARVQNARYDGYRLTYGGLDYLALRTFTKRKPASVSSVGKKIGVGKESDIYVVADDAGEKRVLKLHRLGRISFRAIKSKRDYLGKRSSASWMYMSRLSAQKEFAYMKVLYDNDFPVPTPIDYARHCIVMSLVDSFPLRQIGHVDSPAELYGQLMEMILRFARAGLIHGDFNEFNILLKRKSGEPVIIDFPQMVSTRHENAEFFFNRDVNCIRRFFRKRFRFEGQVWPVWADVLAEEAEMDAAEAAAAAATAAGAAEEDSEESKGVDASIAESSTAPAKRLRLDLEVEASGFGRALQRELENYMEDVQDIPASDDDDDEEEEEEGEEDDEEQDDNDEEAEPLDEEAENERISARLEAVRLHQALGNDGDPSDPLPEPESSDFPTDEDSDSDSDGSIGPAPSDYTQYVRAPRAPRQRVNVSKVGSSKLGAIDELKTVVAAEVGRERDKQAKHNAKKGKVGNAKGHKWKTSANYLVGKSSGGF